MFHDNYVIRMMSLFFVEDLNPGASSMETVVEPINDAPGFRSYEEQFRNFKYIFVPPPACRLGKLFARHVVNIRRTICEIDIYNLLQHDTDVLHLEMSSMT